MKILKQLTIILSFLTISFTSILQAEVIIADDFTVTSSGFPVSGDVNLQIGNGRQTGTLAPLSYTWWPGLSGNATPRLTSAGAREGLCTYDRAVSMNPDKNFTDLTNGFSIEFDLIRLGNIDYGTSVGFGKAYQWAGWQHPYGLDIVFNRTSGMPGYFISDNATGSDLSDTGPTKGYFQFPELAYETNPTIRVKVCVLNDVFPATNYARFSLFLNEIPYPVYTNGTGSVFSHTITSKPTNNYIVINQNPPYDDGGVLDPVIAIDNFKIATLSDKPFGNTVWTDDISSGIDSSKIYTHAVNFGAMNDTTINGLIFSGSGSNFYGSNWKLISASSTPLTGPFSSYAEGKSPAISGASLGLVSNFIKAANSDSAGGLLISGLIPGLNYKVSLYGFGFEAAGGRSSYISTSDGINFPVIDQDSFGENGGQLLTYEYTASANGTFSISTTPITPATPAWNWYAFCNEILPPAAPASISASKGAYTNKIDVTWSTVDSAQSYFVYRADSSDISTTNLVTQLVSNSYTDTIPAITLAQDYYYWVSASNTGGISSLTGPTLGYTKSTPPDAPTAISPAGITVTSPVEFTASSFNDGSGFTFDTSEWQVSPNSSFSSIAWTTGKSGPPVTSIFASRISIPNGTNFWRVRYKNNKNTWSAWSNSNMFICVQGTTLSGIFEDNFNVIGKGNINYNCNAAGRQSGNAIPLNYIVSGNSEIGSGATNPGELLLGENSGVLPLMSFESCDKFNVEFDVKIHNFDSSADYVSLSIGNENQSSVLPEDATGLGARFYANGTFQFYNGTQLLHSEANAFQANDKCHVLITTSANGFDEGDSAYRSVFVNGKPMVNNDAFNKYSYKLLSGLIKNYVVMYNHNDVGTSASLIDNLKISCAATNVISVHPWTGDSDSLIESSKSYTHLVNISGDDVTINSHTFTGTGVLTNQGFANGDPHYTTSNWALIDASNFLIAWSPDPPLVPNLTDNSFDLGQFGVIGAGSPALILSGLTPNSSNTLYIYSFAHTIGTDITFPNSYGSAIEKIDVDQYGELNGIIIQCDYIADSNGKFVIAATPENGDIRFFICGFANIETGTQNPKIDVDNMLAFGETSLKTLPLEIANIGGGVVDGTINGITVPFSLSTNYYYAVPGSNDSILVTFAPTEERDYTNIITLTGNGGTVDVTLIGTAIPEPGLFIICYLAIYCLSLCRK